MTTLPNWVDLVLLILVVRACYIGMEHGALAAMVNGLAAVSATIVALNATPTLWGMAEQWLPIGGPLGQTVTFWTLFVIAVLMAQTLARWLGGVIKGERLHWTVQMLGLLFGAARGLWWAAVLLTAFAGSGLPYLQASAGERSVLGAALTQPSEQVVRFVADQFPGAAGRGETLIPSWVPPAADQPRR